MIDSDLPRTNLRQAAFGASTRTSAAERAPVAITSSRPRGTFGEGDVVPLIVESCHSTWIFDEVNHRFRRLIKGPRIDRSISTGWRTYHHVIFDDDASAFLVFLDSFGTRLLRSWRHVGPCKQCGESTIEMSVDELRRLVAV